MTTKNHITKVQKRNGDIVEFVPEKIFSAVFKAITATKQGNGKKTQQIAESVIKILNRRFKKDEVPNVEQIQDIVEEVLILEGEAIAAKGFILYREQRRIIRESQLIAEEAVDRVDDYLDKLDWEVQENSNMTFSLQGLNHYGVSYIVKKYWLNKVYPSEVREANQSGDIHLHNLDTLACYCVGWDLYDLLLKGFGGVNGKIESSPPKHFRSALGQVVNFMYTLQGEAAGAVSFSNFDTLLAPFIRYDNLSYPQVEQAIQEFLYNMAVPTRVGFQCPFTNVTLDLKPASTFANQSVIIGGVPQKETYSEFEEEMKMLDKAFYTAMIKGDKSGRPFSFPIPTINITPDFPWDDPALDPLFEASAKYGINYFANYINSDMKPEDARSMCLHPEETMLIKENNDIKKFTIEEIFKEYKGEKIDNEWFETKNKIEALSLNPDTGKFEWANISKFLKTTDNKIVKIAAKDGKTMRVSANHLVAVFNENGITTKKAKDLDLDDLILVTKDASNILNKQPIITDDLAWFMGLFIADGNYLYDSRYEKEVLRGVQISFNKQETNLINRTKKFIKEHLNYDMKFILDPRYDNSLRGYIYNSEFADNLKNNLDLRKYNKLPNWIWSSDINTITKFIEGFFDGDGYENGKEIHINDESLAVEINLLMQLIGISTTLRYRENSQVIRLQHVLGRGSENNKIIKDKLHNLIPQFLMDKKYIKEESGNNIYQSYGCKMVGLSTIDRWNLSNDKIESLRNSDYAVTEIKNIEKEDLDYQQEFYDVELEKNHYFVHSDGNITHNCCRLRLDMTQLANRGGGGLFGSGSLTGSIGVVTINLPRIGYLSKTKKEFFERLEKMMDIAKESLEIKRKTIEEFTSKGLYPYSKYYLAGVKKAKGQYFANHFSTIGICGMNEALLNFMGEDIGSKKGRSFTIEVMDFMRSVLVRYQNETNNIYNLEATPAESTSYRLAQKDRKLYPDIIALGTKKVPYYTNSTQLPVNYTDDIFEEVKLQDDIQCKYTGGTVEHIFIGEELSDIGAVKSLVRKIFEKNKLPYITITPTFSICPTHGYIAGKHFNCPKCAIEQPCEVYSRVVGYLRPVSQWNEGKQQEFKDRKEFKKSLFK